MWVQLGMQIMQTRTCENMTCMHARKRAQRGINTGVGLSEPPPARSVVLGRSPECLRQRRCGRGTCALLLGALLFFGAQGFRFMAQG